MVGAQAVAAYGVARLSADVDVTLALTPDAPERFAHDLLEEALGPSALVSAFDAIAKL